VPTVQEESQNRRADGGDVGPKLVAQRMAARARGAGDVAASRSSIVLPRLSVSALLSPLEHYLLERVFRAVEQEQVV
jgi:hypothetical protein